MWACVTVGGRPEACGFCPQACPAVAGTAPGVARWDPGSQRSPSPPPCPGPPPLLMSPAPHAQVAAWSGRKPSPPGYRGRGVSAPVQWAPSAAPVSWATQTWALWKDSWLPAVGDSSAGLAAGTAAQQSGQGGALGQHMGCPSLSFPRRSGPARLGPCSQTGRVGRASWGHRASGESPGLLGAAAAEKTPQLSSGEGDPLRAQLPREAVCLSCWEDAETLPSAPRRGLGAGPGPAAQRVVTRSSQL